MKLKCPVCQKDLYTNPFASNATLDCPACGSHLERTPQTESLLKVLLVAALLFGVVLEAVLEALLGRSKALLIVTVWFLSGAMFEMPARYLAAANQLKYQKKQ